MTTAVNWRKSLIAIALLVVFFQLVLQSEFFLKRDLDRRPTNNSNEEYCWPQDSQQNNEDVKENASTSETKIAVLAVNSEPKYAFYAPLTALLWKERIGFEPIIFLIGNETEWKTKPHLKTIVNTLNMWNITRVLFVETAPEFSVITSQVSRIITAYLLTGPTNTINANLALNDFLITTDIDLWPIKRDFYNIDIITKGEKDILVTNAFCCGTFRYKGSDYREFPIGHIGMTVKNWMDVVPLSRIHVLPSEILNITQELAIKYFDNLKIDNSKPEVEGWSMDQHLISINIANSKYYPNRTELRPHPGCRLDRANFPTIPPSQAFINSRTDAHLVRPAYTNHWPIISHLFAGLLPDDDPIKRKAWQNDASLYRENFLEGLKKNN